MNRCGYSARIHLQKTEAKSSGGTPVAVLNRVLFIRRTFATVLPCLFHSFANMNFKGYSARFPAFPRLGVIMACLLFCHLARAQAAPVISGVYPNGFYQFQPSGALTFTVSSSVGIAPSAITVQLTGATLAGQPFSTTLTTANGLKVSGPSSSRSVSAPLASNTVYTAVLQATDANETTASTTISLTP